VLVRFGVYTENIDFLGKAITVKSEWGTGVAVIDGMRLGSVVTFHGGEGPGSILEGFAIKNGLAMYGGGVLCIQSSPTLRHNVVTGNSATMNGGGMENYDNSNPILTNCTFAVNTAAYGGGMSNDLNSMPVLTNCTIAENWAQVTGGGMYNSYTNIPTVFNCILWADGPSEIYNVQANITLTYSCVHGGTGQSWFGQGCIDMDPGFVQGPKGPYYLNQPPTQPYTSPCVDAGDPASDLIHRATRTDETMDQGIVDMGFHYPEAVPLPPGGILMWSGTLSSIPDGWHLCDGSNGTPDLLDRFILSVFPGQDPGEVGGQHDLTLSSAEAPSHAHWFDTTFTGNHAHFFETEYDGLHDHEGLNDALYLQGDLGDANAVPPFYIKFSYTYNTSYAGSHSHDGETTISGEHTHTGTVTENGGDQPIDNRPAFYELAFIMRDWGEVHPGVIIMWSGALNSIPAGWELCDGLHSTPDLRDRFILSVAAGQDPGGTGGNHSLILSASQIPAHTHDSIDTAPAGGHIHDVETSVDGDHPHYAANVLQSGVSMGDKNAAGPKLASISDETLKGTAEHSHPGTKTNETGLHQHSGHTQSAGGNQPIDNRPAYYTMAFLMKNWGELPSEAIVMWSDKLDFIPTQWGLCDGLGQRPDLRDRFILGAKAFENPGSIGGEHFYTLDPSQILDHEHLILTGDSGDHDHMVELHWPGPHSHILDNVLVPGGDLGNGNAGPPNMVSIGKLAVSDAGNHRHTGSAEHSNGHQHTGYTSVSGGGSVPQPVDNRPAYYRLAFITSGWDAAYNAMFNNWSDLGLLQRYRDEVLNKTKNGSRYTNLLYRHSQEALEVLLFNPRLMLRAKALIEANRDAVSQVLNGMEGMIHDTEEIVTFLDALAAKSPAGLRSLAVRVKSEMLRKQKRGEPFLGFTLSE
jgi:hypothetical protein